MEVERRGAIMGNAAVGGRVFGETPLESPATR